MAWVEQTGTRSWRVRYPRPSGRHGSIAGFRSRKAAQDYAEDLESDRRHGRWLDPDEAKTTVEDWAGRWVETLDVETRTEENYHSYLRNHILPRWQTIPLGDITALAVTSWRKDLRKHLAASTVACIFTVFSMLLDDAVGLLTHYSNRSDLLHELGEATLRLERASHDEQPSVRSVRSPKRRSRVLTERLSDAEQRKIILEYEAGELQRVVAERHHISVRSVRRLLRQYRQRPDDAA